METQSGVRQDFFPVTYGCYNYSNLLQNQEKYTSLKQTLQALTSTLVPRKRHALKGCIEGEGSLFVLTFYVNVNISPVAARADLQKL